uniref:F-box/LRR-repeat protein 5 n=1 Tax=Cajanus cajan TaxID=3821 RepID=A0A151U3Q3_CAJCA|nr:F-box/LRR-repeat protein 5 [Cajanus cajan]
MDEEDVWCRETVPKVLKLVCSTLPLSHTDLVSLLLVSPSLHRTLLSSQPLCQSLNFRELNNAGNRLLAALSLPRYSSVKHINLEFARDVEDAHFIVIKDKCFNSLQSLESLNLNGCQKISDTGIEAITSCCPKLKSFSIYWNVRFIYLVYVDDIVITGDDQEGIKALKQHLFKHFQTKDLGPLRYFIGIEVAQSKFGIAISQRKYAKLDESGNVVRNKVSQPPGFENDLLPSHVFKLNKALYGLKQAPRAWYDKLSSFLISNNFIRGKIDNTLFRKELKALNISDRGIQLVADNYPELESLNLTRCVKVTDEGLKSLLHKCLFLQSLNLYALSSFTDEAYQKIYLLARLKFLDLCGAQNLSDEGLSCISKCKNLVSLNLTWCVRVTDEGVISIAECCISLEFLSLFGIIGVTDKCLDALSKSCSDKLTTLDVNGSFIPLQKRSREELLKLFPYLKCFKVHS